MNQAMLVSTVLEGRHCTERTIPDSVMVCNRRSHRQDRRKAARAMTDLENSEYPSLDLIALQCPWVGASVLRRRI